ncbi:MarR family winged helix-turn-helix transcriptional regulator [Pukyongiella litopenaei]|uniref:Winged helix-turn-helix transcriptional regulator n=1 Tax=Pukyongiella litopenaei TaxID=2605946 RepID=A0A2S0MPE2_9RHOB|nr:MarR family winged helix-turn-helix transcriptional regulator [Pukyongiella litopenaei]AVO37583.1 winged helix-turn-helix transcriptional regulator [Pukyongiella litopenaei]
MNCQPSNATLPNSGPSSGPNAGPNAGPDIGPETSPETGPESGAVYILDQQVGFLMRRANQRHIGIFSERIPDLTPRQFAALAKLCELGDLSQNALGRAIAMDAATIKGVVDRLRARDLVTASPDPNDQRRLRLVASAEGRALYEGLEDQARAVTRMTLTPLEPHERGEFLRLLEKIT